MVPTATPPWPASQPAESPPTPRDHASQRHATPSGFKRLETATPAPACPHAATAPTRQPAQAGTATALPPPVQRHTSTSSNCTAAETVTSPPSSRHTPIQRHVRAPTSCRAAETAMPPSHPCPTPKQRHSSTPPGSQAAETAAVCVHPPSPSAAPKQRHTRLARINKSHSRSDPKDPTSIRRPPLPKGSLELQALLSQHDPPQSRDCNELRSLVKKSRGARGDCANRPRVQFAQQDGGCRYGRGLGPFCDLILEEICEADGTILDQCDVGRRDS